MFRRMRSEGHTAVEVKNTGCKRVSATEIVSLMDQRPLIPIVRMPGACSNRNLSSLGKEDQNFRSIEMACARTRKPSDYQSCTKLDVLGGAVATLSSAQGQTLMKNFDLQEDRPSRRCLELCFQER
jgi:hypothetical protein